MNKEKETIIINCGVFGYNAVKIASILEEDIKIVQKNLKDKNHDYHRLYKIGIDKSDYVIDLKLFEMAKSGDIKALEKLELRKSLRET